MCAKIAQNHETKEQKGENSQSAGLPLFVAPLKMNNGEQLSMMNKKLNDYPQSYHQIINNKG